MDAKPMNILLTSAGRRVALIDHFRSALRSLGVAGKVYAADNDPTAPTLQSADGAVILPRVNSPEYVDVLRDFCVTHGIKLVIPLIDPELDVLAPAREALRDAGVRVMVSTEQAVRIIRDKLLTAEFFSEVKVSCPLTTSADGASAREIVERVGTPLILKPRRGSSGQGVAHCNTLSELERALADLRGPYIAQQYVRGVEVTIDVFGDGNGNVLSMVPRKRLKVRGGEVERAVTVPDAPFRVDILRIAAALKPFGAINVQCLVSEEGPQYTEINGRFGGGYPLAHAAGARFPELLLQMELGESPEPRLGRYEIGLVMSRYDEAVFARAEALVDGEKLTNLPEATSER